MRRGEHDASLSALMIVGEEILASVQEVDDPSSLPALADDLDGFR